MISTSEGNDLAGGKMKVQEIKKYIYSQCNTGWRWKGQDLFPSFIEI